MVLDLNYRQELVREESPVEEDEFFGGVGLLTSNNRWCSGFDDVQLGCFDTV